MNRRYYLSKHSHVIFREYPRGGSDPIKGCLILQHVKLPSNGNADTIYIDVNLDNENDQKFLDDLQEQINELRAKG